MFSPSPELPGITHLYRTSDWTDGQRDRPPKAFTEDRASGMGGGGGRVGEPHWQATVACWKCGVFNVMYDTRVAGL